MRYGRCRSLYSVSARPCFPVLFSAVIASTCLSDTPPASAPGGAPARAPSTPDALRRAEVGEAFNVVRISVFAAAANFKDRTTGAVTPETTTTLCGRDSAHHDKAARARARQLCAAAAESAWPKSCATASR